MMLPPTATSVPKASAFPFGAYAETTVRSLDRSESTVPQGPCVALVPLTGFSPKMCIPDARCGLGQPTSYSGSTGSGWPRILPGGGTLGVRRSASPGTFGILQEQLSARRFLLRGLANVRAEFALLATAFNLRTLWKVWRTRRRPPVTEGSQHLNRPACISSSV